MIRPALEAELGGPVDEVFAEFDWEPLAAASIGQTYRGPAADRRGGRREDPAAGHRRRHRARPRGARAARQRRAATHDVRPGSPIRRDARAVRDQPPRRARLPARGRRRCSRWRCCSAPTRRSACRACTREYCTRRLLVQERFDGFTVAEIRGARRRRHRPRRSLAERAAALDARPGAADRALPRRSAPRQHLRLPRRQPRPHRLRRGRPARPHPAGGGRRHARRADRGATSSLLRDGIERVAEVQNADRPEELERALARLLADHVRVDRRRRPVGAAGPRRHAGALRHPAPRPISSCCRARWSPSTARSACSRPSCRS